MAPGRGTRRPTARQTSQHAKSVGTRASRARRDAAPSTAGEVYDDLLAEAAVVDPVEELHDRPLKRRKVMHDIDTSLSKKDVKSTDQAAGHDELSSTSDFAGPTLHDSFTSEESDFEFEDVDISSHAQQYDVEHGSESGIEDVSVAVKPTSSGCHKQRFQARRKPATNSEKALRILAHKAHFLCLLGHGMVVNSRCSDQRVHARLDFLLDRRMRSFLNPRTDFTQFQQNHTFMDGLQRASKAFSVAFNVTTSAMSRAQWLDDDDKSQTRSKIEPMDRQDFINAAKYLCGSQDTGNQLFCALLRAAGVEARLVCSLQVLPFSSSNAKLSTPERPRKPAVFAIASNSPQYTSNDDDDRAIDSPSSTSKIPSVRRRLGQPGFRAEVLTQTPPEKKKRPIRKLTFPVFWVEAFDAAYQKWIPVDPVVTDTINKASKLEPPGAYALNQLVYAIAFEEGGSAKDVTRRYAKAFNAKTRRMRLESAREEDSRWLHKTLRLFRRRTKLTRDEIEDTELVQREAREGLPSNVQDFKDHPVYALERHLRRHEVINPRREVGKVNAGTAAKPRMETVFRRADVHACRSAKKWFRVGRVIKEGEQPLKRVPARVRRKDVRDDSEDDEAEHLTALYAVGQTDLYVPPRVERGRVPRNAFGNLEVFVPSMLPAGGAHIRHPLTKEAAAILRVDAVDAVTGFKFTGRQGTTVVEGAVIPASFADAVQAVVEGLEWESTLDECRSRSLLAMRLWMRFLKGLQIAERVASYADKGVDGKAGEADTEDKHDIVTFSTLAEENDNGAPLHSAGKYTIDELLKPNKPAKQKKKRVASSSGSEDVIDDEAGGFVPEEDVRSDEYGGGFVPDESIHENDDKGIIAEDLDHGDGGFLREDEPEHGLNEHNDDNDGAESKLFGDDSASDQDMVAVKGGGFLYPSDDEDTEVQRALHDSISNHHADSYHDVPHRGKGSNDGTDGSVAGACSKSHELEGVSLAKDDHKASSSVGKSPPKARDSDAEDKGRDYSESLLSHDPEDEDAEPDWLESE